MKQSRLVGFSLTLLMLLLVLVAAFVFTYQAQRDLQKRLGDRAAALATQEAAGTLTAVSVQEIAATRAALTDQLANTAAEVEALDQQLNTKLQENAVIFAQATAAWTAAQEQIETLQQELANQEAALTLEIITQPQVVGEAVVFVAAASDNQGIAQIEVRYDDTTTAYPAENRPLFARVISQTITTAGEYTVTVTVRNLNQLTTTGIVTGAVQTAVNFRQTEIANTLQGLAAQSNLEPEAPPIFIRRAVFSQWLSAQFGDLSPETIARQTRVLRAFGLVSAVEADALPDNVSAWQQTDFVALFYDETTQRLVPIDEAAWESELAAWWLVIEQTTPAAQPVEGSGVDAQLGFQGQVLGEAALLQGLYLARSGETAIPTDPLRSAPNAAFANFPIPLRQQLLFPYAQGYQWALAIYRESGIAGVRAARQAEISTSQLLAPAAASPQTVTLPELTPVIGDTWELQGAGVWGAWRLQQLLALRDADAQKTAVAGWAGDRYVVYWRPADDALLLALRVAWDAGASATAFTAAYDAFASSLTGSAVASDVAHGACWQGESEVLCRFAAAGETLLLVRAPTMELAQDIAQLLPPAQ